MRPVHYNKRAQATILQALIANKPGPLRPTYRIFPGPVLVISHDGWFMQRFGGVSWELVQGKLRPREDAGIAPF